MGTQKEMGKCPSEEGIPSPSQTLPPPWSARGASALARNAAFPSEDSGRARACRPKPLPRSGSGDAAPRGPREPAGKRGGDLRAQRGPWLGARI